MTRVSISSKINESKLFITVALIYFDIKNVRFRISGSTATYPDIWCTPRSKPPVITVTGEWASKGKSDRERRIVHELLHCCGMEHGKPKGYSTYPDKDVYSWIVYEGIIENFDAIRYGRCRFKGI